MSAPSSSPFRQEALDYHARDQAGGALLRLSPGWSRWSYWLLLAIVLAATVYGFVGRVNDYASGPAVIRVDGRVDVTAKVAGTVARVEVQPGQRVAEGQPLVQFFMDDEQADRERLQKEFDLQLLKLLRDPSDAAARQSLSSLRAQRELASARLQQRLVAAPRAGIVSDVRIHPGEHLGVGDHVVTIIGDDARMSLVALLPGRYRPMLRPGLPMRFELSGYKYEYRQLTIDSIGDEIIGPAEAKRYLGPGVADGVAVDGPVVLVRASMPSTRFSSGGRDYRYFDGLPALADARVRSEPIVVSFVPALKVLFPHEP
ncbi:MAG TPA: HlyD family efflux transporter periplasmic adaptor subunit [Polyangia bacterium]|nr:HlyD family efflux transporter periplasmic adaptor subunit [Polyangia bacterium]